MTRDILHNILDMFFITTKKEDNRIKLSFNIKDKTLGYVYYKPNQIVGKRKPIRQNVYVLDYFEMVGVMDYINEKSPIRENDFELINRVINEYCVNILKRETH